MASEFEIVLPRRVVPQPTPFIVPGGDCGACVLAGVLGISIERVYDDLREKRDSIHYSEMQRLLRVADSRGLARGYCDDPPIWIPFGASTGFFTFGLNSWHMTGAWFRYLTMAFEAGYYAIAGVNHEKAGPMSHGRDHWVLLCGARSRFEPRPCTCSDPNCRAGSYENEILVSCSSRATPDEEWVTPHDFLRNRGGLDALLVRPA